MLICRGTHERAPRMRCAPCAEDRAESARAVPLEVLEEAEAQVTLELLPLARPAHACTRTRMGPGADVCVESKGLPGQTTA